MRKLLVSLVCTGVLSGPVMGVEKIASVLTPTPISAAITIGTWILTSDKKKLYEVEVQAQAGTFEAAKKEGFRLAVEHAVGSLILSETEVRNDRAKRDEIITYASGFVDRFEIVQRTETSNGVRLQMKIWVAHSGIAQRLLNKSETAGDLEGPRVQAKVETYQTYRSSADRVLGAVLNDYPHRAFDVLLGSAQTTLDANRQPVVAIPFTLRWNEKYINSLSETVRRINPKPECTDWYRQCTARSTVIVRANIAAADPQAWFDDNITWELMFNRMVLTRPSYRVIVRDQSGNVQMRQCYPARELDGLEYRSQYFADIGPGRVIINAQMTQRLYIELPQNINIGTMGRVEVSIVTQSQC